MESLILILHVLVAAAMIGLILLQQGKGAEMGASFGAGASQTVFGAAGSAGFLTKLTAALAAVFWRTSVARGRVMPATSSGSVCAKFGCASASCSPVTAGCLRR